MRHLGDHAARRRIVLHFLHAADLVQPKPDQRRALAAVAADRAADLLDLDGLLRCHDALPSEVASVRLLGGRLDALFAAARLQGRDLDQRRAATERGESWCFSASKVARTML